MFHTPRFARLFGLLFALVLLVAWLSSVRAATEPAAPVQVDGAPPSIQAPPTPPAALNQSGVDLSPAAFDLVNGGKPIKPAGKPLTPPADRPAPRPALTPPAAAAGILAPSTVSQSQIVNGDFELGDTGWYRNSKNGNPIIIHDGSSWVARLGGSNNEEGWFGQTVTVSADMPLLQYSYRVVSEEVGCTYDRVDVWVSGAILRTYDPCAVLWFSWHYDTIPLDDYVGQTIWIEFNVITDGSYISSFYFDYIGLRAYGDCVELVRTHEGQGGDPVATPASMIGCSPGWYRGGTTVTLTASPAAGWYVARWEGTNNNSSTSTTNSVTTDPFGPWRQTATVFYEPACYTLSRNHEGQGGDPTTSPTNSIGCPNGQYTAGQSITVYASPAAGYRVTGWSGTNNNASTATTNTVTMPASNHTVSVIYGQSCYTLSHNHEGQGGDPTTNPTNSIGCSAGQYTAGQSITVYASPAAGWYVTGWSGTTNNASTATTNTVTMPAYNHTVGVTYGQSCYALTLTHTGQGGDPTTNPTNSTGCSAGQYTAGQSIIVYASPDAGYRVTGWTGTTDNASTATTNTVTMPASNHTVGVTYGAIPPTCYVLTRNHTGNGDDPTANPTNSANCPANQYTAGQSIVVSASPAAGWVVSGWTGTNNNSSTSTSNVVSMPAGPHTVTVKYAQPACYPLTLSHEGQGGDPVASPANSPGCANGKYHEGTAISLSATPASGWEMIGWQGSIDDNSHDTSNFAFMPAGPHEVVARYGRSTVLGELLFLPSVVSIPSTAPGCYQGEMEKNPNNTRSQATANGAFCFDKTYRGLPEDNLDTFLYQLTTSGRISALVTNLRWGASQAALVLSDKDGNPLKRDEAAADRLAFTSDTLPPGNYFITIILDKPNATETTQYSLLVEMVETR